MLGLEQLWGMKVGLILDDSWLVPRMSPKCHQELIPLPVVSFSLDVSDVSLDVDLSRNGRVKSKGKDKVMRSFAVGNVQRANTGCTRLQSLPRKPPGGRGTWVVLLMSELGQVTWQILNLLIEEEKTLFSYSVPKSPTSPVQP